jgi:molybdopterin converting factor small subunit
MQTVSVRFYAGLQAMMGQKVVDVDVRERATVAELRDRIVEDYPILGALMPTLACAVNDEMAPDEHVLVAGDDVELIPPIAGG